MTESRFERSRRFWHKQGESGKTRSLKTHSCACVPHLAKPKRDAVFALEELRRRLVERVSLTRCELELDRALRQLHRRRPP
jgi:hypothetical protein